MRGIDVELRFAMTKHTKKTMSAVFKKRARKVIDTIEREELDELMAQGQRYRERQDRLIDALQALKAERENSRNPGSIK